MSHLLEKGEKGKKPIWLKSKLFEQLFEQYKKFILFRAELFKKGLEEIVPEVQAISEAVAEAPSPEELTTETKAEELLARVDDAVSDPLLFLFTSWKGLSPEAKPDYSAFTEDRNLPPEELSEFLEELREAARGILKNTVEEEYPLAESEQKLLPSDAFIKVYITPDQLAAWCFLFPPLDGGRDMFPKDISSQFSSAGVTAGIPDGLAQKISFGRRYMQLIPIAWGKACKDGVDGEVIDVIPRTVGSRYIDQGSQKPVDFKNLNWLVQVKAGDVICNVIAPVPPEDGFTVTGRTLQGVPGKVPALPCGKNVLRNEDGTALIAAVDGQISFVKEVYRVDQLVTVEGNVDLSTGNLNVTGNLLVKGDVCDGFKVCASGDITIQGIVEDSSVVAGGNVFVRRGMNGNSGGMIQAGKDVKCSYLENGTITAEGNVTVESAINSKIECSGQVIAKSGRGVIIGGSITALESIEAKLVGNDSNRFTKLTVGRTSEFIIARDRAAEKLEELQQESDKLLGIMTMLAKSPDPDDQEILKAIKLKSASTQLRLAAAQKESKAFAEKEEKAVNSHMMVGQLFPVTQITVDGVSKVLYDMQYHCNIFKRDGEICIGSK